MKKNSCISVVKISEGYNFKEVVEKEIINNAFSLDSMDIDSTKLEGFSNSLTKLTDKINSSIKEIDVKMFMKKDNSDKENMFTQTLNTDRKTQASFADSLMKKKFEDLKFFNVLPESTSNNNNKKKNDLKLNIDFNSSKIMNKPSKKLSLTPRSSKNNSQTTPKSVGGNPSINNYNVPQHVKENYNLVNLQQQHSSAQNNSKKG